MTTHHRKPDDRNDRVLGQWARVVVIVWLSFLATVLIITVAALMAGPTPS